MAMAGYRSSASGGKEGDVEPITSMHFEQALKQKQIPRYARDDSK